MSPPVVDPANSEVVEDIRLLLDRAVQDDRDLEAMGRACVEMDRMREELRSQIGTVELAVDLIRAGRAE